MLSSSNDNMLLQVAAADCRWKPNVELAPNCPRCDSAKTKFCYYNNYSLSQPRYFCKGCRRYWTKGGSLRNVPVGGGCRKNRRGKSARLSTVAAPSPAGRDVSSRHPLPRPIRPDLMLDDMATDSAVAAPAGGSAIDLEVLYAKYLNQCPQVESGSVVMDHETLVSVRTSSESSSCNQMPIQFPNQQGFLECQSIIAQPMDQSYSIGDSNLSVDLSSPLALQMEPGNNYISLDCPSGSNLIYEEFESSIPASSMHDQQSLVLNDDWSSLDYSSLDAFYGC